MSTRHLVLALLSLSLAAACSSSHEPTSRACVPAFGPCESHADCCAGTYCTGPYGPTECAPVSPDGVFCVDALECASGVCSDNVCGGAPPPSCTPPGAECGDSGSPCCAGRCRPDGTGAMSCLLASPDGAPCASADDCESGACSAGVCGPPAPPPPPECLGSFAAGCHEPGARCCEGFYCEPEGSYYEGFCLELLADGASCTEGFGPRCASGHCSDGLCRTSECVALGAPCGGAFHAECCAGFCDWDFSYGPGTCAARLAAGATCADHAWCASGYCNDDHTCL